MATRRKPKSWDGESTLCTSPYPIKKNGCWGKVDFGAGLQYAPPDGEPQRYCIPCHVRQCREDDEESEKKMRAWEKAHPPPPPAPECGPPVAPPVGDPADGKAGKPEGQEAPPVPQRDAGADREVPVPPAAKPKRRKKRGRGDHDQAGQLALPFSV